MREIVVLSGKGGTGKTSLLASFATLASGVVVADCDVDAADLHLLLEPRESEIHAFTGGKIAEINSELCTLCGKCRKVCRFQAIRVVRNASGTPRMVIDASACEGCGACVTVCPAKGILLSPHVNGDWRVSKTRVGTMVHAELGVAEENSGKLVTQVRKVAREIALAEGADWLLGDGPPGTGCPVIASLTGADAVVAVVEPSLAGAHDFARLHSLARHFGIPLFLVVNRWDISPELTEKLEQEALATGAKLLGRVPFDLEVVQGQMEGWSPVEWGRGEASEAIREVWCRLLLQFDSSAAVARLRMEECWN